MLNNTEVTVDHTFTKNVARELIFHQMSTVYGVDLSEPEYLYCPQINKV